MKRLVFLTGGPRCPSDRFRIYAYLPHLREAKIPYRVMPTWTPRYPSLWLPASIESQPVRAACAIAQAAGRALDLTRIRGNDVVVIQREALSWGPAWVEQRLAGRAAKIVIDLDDAVYLPATFQTDKERAAKEARWNEILSCVDFMIVGNEMLAELPESRNIPYIIIPTPVDTDYFQPTPRPDKMIVGWIGTRTNLCYIEPLLPILRALSEEFSNLSFEFVLNQSRSVKIDLPRLTLHEWTFEAEKAALARWPIGIMPLADDPWSRRKCGMKLLQYMASGVAAVGSPVGVNEQILQNAGLAARLPEEWHEQLRMFIKNPELRATCAEHARTKVVENWSLEKWAPEFVGTCRSFL